MRKSKTIRTRKPDAGSIKQALQKEPCSTQRERERLYLDIVRQALALHLAKDFTRALAAYDRALAIDPNFSVAHHGRGTVLRITGKDEEALAAFDRALALDPEYADAHYHRGLVLQKLEKYPEALAAFDRALSLKPAYAAVHNDRAVVLQELGRHEDALSAWKRAIVAKPAFAQAHFNLGAALKQAGQFEEALNAFDRAVTVDPAFAAAHFSRGVALRKLHRYAEALTAFDRLLAVEPTWAEAHLNRGFVLQELARHTEALSAYEQTLALQADYPAALWNKSLILLLKGDYPEGWRLYEKRHEVMTQFARRFEQPFLDLNRREQEGKTVLLYAEQGLGDAIQMLRYVPLLAARGFRMIVELPEALVPLAAGLPGVEFAGGQNKIPPDYDLHCSLMSLPLVFDTTVETIPAAVPYLSAPPDRISLWQNRLAEKIRPRIGLAWSGGKDHENDSLRSIPLATLLPLLDADAEFHSLQKEYRPADALILPELQERLQNHADSLFDFGDTAALLEQMDLIVSVDTAVAHLAGALGKPVWILLPFAGDFRWLIDREDSPWYPTARLIRQQGFGVWKPVVGRIKSLLHQHIPNIDQARLGRMKIF